MGEVIQGAAAPSGTGEVLPSRGTLQVSLKGTGVAMVASGLALAAVVPLHPSILGDREIAAVVLDTGAWQAIHIGLAVSAILGLFGAAGIVAAHEGRMGRLGQRALVAIIVGTTTTACVVYLEATAFPAVARRVPELVDLHGPIVGSLLLRATAAPAVGYPLGFAALGMAAARASDHRRAGLALTWSALAFAVGEGLFVPVLGLLSTVAFSTVLVWWGWLLWLAEAPRHDRPRRR